MANKDKIYPYPCPLEKDVEVWDEETIVYYDGPLVVARTVNIPNIFKEPLLELTYAVCETTLDVDASSVSIRWTKAQLLDMLSMLEKTQEAINEQKSKDCHHTGNSDTERRESFDDFGRGKNL